MSDSDKTIRDKVYPGIMEAIYQMYADNIMYFRYDKNNESLQDMLKKANNRKIASLKKNLCDAIDAQHKAMETLCGITETEQRQI